MSSNSYFKLNNTSAKNFGLNFQNKSWLTLKKKTKPLSYPVLALYWCPVWYN